ncbi:hypothetical protein LTSEALA_0885, partial [Salmonella enterica subsp. enterica serovar Alachua str. R6-377]
TFGTTTSASGAITGYLLCHGWLRDGRRQIVSADPVNIQTVVVGFSPRFGKPLPYLIGGIILRV